MAPLVERLDAAAAALDRGDSAAALADIVAAWQMQHHSRIGALAGRISALAGAGRPPISGKTVKERLAAWLEAEKTHDLVDIERLLADPWPTQWRDGRARFEQIVKWAPDPRVAAHLIRAFVDPPYDSEASYGLRMRLLRHLMALEDPRSIEVVQQNVDPTPRSHEAARALELLPGFVAKLASIELLEPDVEARVAALEARFASNVRAETASKKTAAEFLEAIYAAPEDVTQKAVFADWLTERGDPRGELIALQLAGKDTPRERALIKTIADDHAAWDWPVAEKFKRGKRRYEHGFFAGGHFERGGQPVDHPGWAYVSAIELDLPAPLGSDISFLARMPRLRELTNIEAQYVLPLLEDSPLEILEIVERPNNRGATPLDATNPIATTTKLRRLKTLGIARALSNNSSLATLPSWPIVRRLEGLMLRNTAGNEAEVRDIIAQIEKLPGPKTIEVRPDRDADRMDEAKVCYRLTRAEAPGPFRRIAVRGAFDDIVMVLDSFPRDAFAHITLDTKRAKPRLADQKRLAEALARFPNAAVDPPIEGLVPPAAAEPRSETVAVLEVQMTGARFNEPQNIGRAMRHAAKLGVTFDSYRVGYSDQHRALKPDPIKKAEAMTKPDKRIILYRDGTENSIALAAGRDHFSIELARADLDSSSPKRSRT